MLVGLFSRSAPNGPLRGRGWGIVKIGSLHVFDFFLHAKGNNSAWISGAR